MNPLTAPTVSTVSTPSTALRPLLRLTALAAATVLAACGGGGGGGSTPAPAPAPALPPADLSVTAALVATGYPDLMGNPRPQAIVGDTTVQVRFTAGNAGPTAPCFSWKTTATGAKPTRRPRQRGHGARQQALRHTLPGPPRARSSR